jgi:Calcium binding
MMAPPEWLKRTLSRPIPTSPFRPCDSAAGHSDGIAGKRGGLMKRPSRDEEREQRITMEIVVDAYTPEEQAMGWYYSLEDRLRFPFVAKCTAERSISPLRVGDEVKVVGMAPEEECQHEMFVLIRWERRTLAVPLVQLEGVAVDEQTRQVIEDWQYWVAQGYEL